MITIKLTFNQVFQLTEAHYGRDITDTGDYADLLREHVHEFCTFFSKLMARGHKTYRVRFTSLQACAFMKLWCNQELPLNNTAYLILEIIGELDHANKLLIRI